MLEPSHRAERVGRPARPALGVVHLPARAGCHLWGRGWDAQALDADFARMAADGLAVARLFLFWADFEPEEGRHEPTAFARLREAARLAERHGVKVLPSIVSVMVLLHVFDLPWRRGRDLFADAGMAERAAAFAGAVARCLADAPNVLAYDVHDEQYNLDARTAAALPVDTLRAWQAGVVAAIRSAHPGVPVMQSLDHQGFTGALPFRPEHSAEYDLLGVHGFPQWAPFGASGSGSYTATSTPAFLVALTRAYRPALVDELGLIGADDARVARHLRTAGASALANGAEALLAWCWQDAADPDDIPYAERPWLGRFGLRRADGSPKPALEAFTALNALADALAGCTRPRPAVALYLPERHAAPGVGGRDAGVLLHAYALCKRAHLAVRFARDDLRGAALVIVPAARHLTGADWRRLRAHAEAGGSVWCSARDALDGIDPALFGIEVVDFTRDPTLQDALEFGGTRFPIDWNAGIGSGVPIPVIRATEASVVASYRGAPALTTVRRGAGRVWFLNAPLEAQLDAPGRLEGWPWQAFYRAAAEAAEALPGIDCNEPEIELVELDRPEDGGRRVVLVRHGDTSGPVRLRDAAGREVGTCELMAGGVAWLDLPADRGDAR